MSQVTFLLADNAKPVSFVLQSKHKPKSPLLWYDEKKGKNRSMRYAPNQKSPFEDEQDEHATLSHIIFEDGVLHVQDHEHVLLEFLRKHPRIDDVFYEWDPKKEAEEKYNLEEAILDAKIAVRNLSIDRKKSILRLFREGLAYKTEKMSVDEINYEVMKTAEMDPIGVIESIDDPESSLDDLAARAIRDGFVSVRNGGRDVHYNEKDNKKKAFTVPFEEQPVSALAAWLQTDGGKDFYQRLLKHYEE
jgi:hypothetical protein